MMTKGKGPIEGRQVSTTTAGKGDQISKTVRRFKDRRKGVDGERSDMILKMILQISRWMILEKNIRKNDLVLPALSQIVNNTIWVCHKT